MYTLQLIAALASCLAKPHLTSLIAVDQLINTGHSERVTLEATLTPKINHDNQNPLFTSFGTTINLESNLETLAQFVDAASFLRVYRSCVQEEPHTFPSKKINPSEDVEQALAQLLSSNCSDFVFQFDCQGVQCNIKPVAVKMFRSLPTLPVTSYDKMSNKPPSPVLPTDIDDADYNELKNFAIESRAVPMSLTSNQPISFGKNPGGSEDDVPGEAPEEVFSVEPFGHLLGNLSTAVTGAFLPLTNVFSQFLKQSFKLDDITSNPLAILKPQQDNKWQEGDPNQLLFYRRADASPDEIANAPKHGPNGEDSAPRTQFGRLLEEALTTENDERATNPSENRDSVLELDMAKQPVDHLFKNVQPNKTDAGKRPLFVSGSLEIANDGSLYQDNADRVAEIEAAQETRVSEAAQPDNSQVLLKYPHLHLVAPHRSNPFVSPLDNQNAMQAALSLLSGDFEAPNIQVLPTLKPLPVGLPSGDPVDLVQDWLSRVRLPANVRAATSSVDVLKALSDKSVEVIGNTLTYPARLANLAVQEVLLGPLEELFHSPVSNPRGESEIVQQNMGVEGLGTGAKTNLDFAQVHGAEGLATGLPMLAPPPAIASPVVNVQIAGFSQNSGQMGSPNILQHLTTTDMLPWLPLDAMAAGLPSWISEALVGSYSSLLTDFVRVAERGLLGLQMIVDVVSEVPVPLTSGDISTLAASMGEAFRLSPAGQEADALKTLAVTIRELPLPMTQHEIRSHSLKNILKPLGDFANFPDNLAALIQDFSDKQLLPNSSPLRSLISDAEAPNNDAEQAITTKVFGGIELVVMIPQALDKDGTVWKGQLNLTPSSFRNLTEQPTTSDSLPWLPLDGVLGGLPGFFVNKLGKAGNWIGKAAGVWQKGSVGIDKYAGAVIDPIMESVPGIDKNRNLTLGDTDGLVRNVNQPGETVTIDPDEIKVSGVTLGRDRPNLAPPNRYDDYSQEGNYNNRPSTNTGYDQVPDRPATVDKGNSYYGGSDVYDSRPRQNPYDSRRGNTYDGYSNPRGRSRPDAWFLDDIDTDHYFLSVSEDESATADPTSTPSSMWSRLWNRGSNNNVTPRSVQDSPISFTQQGGWRSWLGGNADEPSIGRGEPSIGRGEPSIGRDEPSIGRGEAQRSTGRQGGSLLAPKTRYHGFSRSESEREDSSRQQFPSADSDYSPFGSHRPGHNPDFAQHDEYELKQRAAWHQAMMAMDSYIRAQASGRQRGSTQPRYYDSLEQLEMEHPLFKNGQTKSRTDERREGATNREGMNRGAPYDGSYGKNYRARSFSLSDSPLY